MASRDYWEELCRDFHICQPVPTQTVVLAAVDTLSVIIATTGAAPTTMKLFALISLASLVVREVSSSPLFEHDIESFVDEFPQTRRSIPETHVQHEKRTGAQERRWVKVERADPHAKLPVRIGLRQRNLQEGHDLLMDMCVVLLREATQPYIELTIPAAPTRSRATTVNTCPRRTSSVSSRRRIRASRPSRNG